MKLRAIVFATLTVTSLTAQRSLATHKKSFSSSLLLRMSSSINDIRVTTYNVLSSNLCDPKYHTSCTKENLDQANRYVKVKAMLQKEVDSKAIICLQEVSTKWACSLHTFFAENKYQFITGLYGHKFNGYMGVAIAVPSDVYDLLTVDITKGSDTMKEIKQPKPTSFQNFKKKYLTDPFTRLKSIFGYRNKPIDPWVESAWKKNDIVTVELKKKSSDKSFFVGTYHMPCVFKVPPLMMIHCALYVQHLQRISNGAAYICTGDFNIKPDSEMYKMITTGTIDENNKEHYPPACAKYENPLKLKIQPLRSAIKVALGEEPAFTNWGQTQDSPPFIGTLDYIFLSDGWNVSSTAPLPSLEATVGPLPNDVQPSDHLLISATLSV